MFVSLLLNSYVNNRFVWALNSPEDYNVAKMHLEATHSELGTYVHCSDVEQRIRLWI
jgi:hypothetical protein